MLRKAKALFAAMKAGWIASKCQTGCVIDDEKEEIRACFLHETEIARLGKINEGWTGDNR